MNFKVELVPALKQNSKTMTQNRRKFLQTIGIGSLASSGIVIPSLASLNSPPNINHIGPLEGFTPQIGTLISMLDWISNSVISYHSSLSTEQLDFIFDEDANSIGSLMLHLAATEVIYQDLTFHGLDDFSPENAKKWGTAMNLGEKARKEIKGNPLSFYKNAYAEVRAETKKQLKKREDDWLLGGETKDWNWNNYCKWFHVVEHYANHRGQMTWIMKRLPK